MIDLENSLRRLSSIHPSKGFVKHAKNRLMSRIELTENENWFKAFLKRLGVVTPPVSFVASAKFRLMERIAAAREPFFLWLFNLKRVTASVLVMVIAVTATLFFVEGGQVVNASEETYVEVLAGTVTLKHADLLVWDDVIARADIAAGDLIRLGDGASAVVHFFDDSQLRLSGKSLILINQLAVSPTYPRQGIIEVSMHEGKAWVQTLNVDDGQARFALTTRDVEFFALNSTFSVETFTGQPTVARVFRNDVEISPLRADTREAVSRSMLASGQKATAVASENVSLPRVVFAKLEDADRADAWAQENLQKDRLHLVALRERDLNLIREAVGALPGDALYPLKQVRERLQLALSFGESDVVGTQIAIANKRLNEAIVLLQNGDQQKGWEALLAYQSLAREIAKSEQLSEAATKLVLPYRKSLVAALPGDTPVVMVREALSQTEEIFISDPIEKEKARLANSVERLRDISSLVEAGDLAAAREAFTHYALVDTSILDEAGKLEDEAVKKEVFDSVLALRRNEMELLSAVAAKLNDAKGGMEMAAMVENATVAAKNEMERAVAFIAPLAPELVANIKSAPTAEEARMERFLAKLSIYKTPQGQKNQLAKLLRQEEMGPSDIGFLAELYIRLEDDMTRELLDERIALLQTKADYLKGKAVKGKIERAKRMRAN
ncbi:FecR domain-containing protein [Candidatus Peregrinibacteria bacterium]|nr:FecR domain-containing protein [Candidatus Peregrinibacteria bacterium]